MDAAVGVCLPIGDDSKKGSVMLNIFKRAFRWYFENAAEMYK